MLSQSTKTCIPHSQVLVCKMKLSNYHTLSVHAGIWFTIIDVMFTDSAIIAQCTLTMEIIHFILWKHTQYETLTAYHSDSMVAYHILLVYDDVSQ